MMENRMPTDVPTPQTQSACGCNSPNCCGENTPVSSPASACSEKRNPFSRRDFLKAMSVAACGAALASTPLSVMAGPFEDSEFAKLVPPDKKLDPEWKKSLFARGVPVRYTGRDLAHIGMPVSGICCGTVYLGGDGKLWLWEIFNKHYGSGVQGRGQDGQLYVQPLDPVYPFEQNFSLGILSSGKVQQHRLDYTGFRDIRFQGAYPMARVDYSDPDVPLKVSLRAFSPFIPLNAADSGLPVTIMEYTVENPTSQTHKVEIEGTVANPVALNTGKPGKVLRSNETVQKDGLSAVVCSAQAVPESSEEPQRPDIVFEDFEKPTYEGWTVTGTAFGAGPIAADKIPSYQKIGQPHGKQLVNTHNARQGEDVEKADGHVGTLTSREFTLERHYINFLVSGGSHKGQTCIQLLIGGKPVREVTGPDNNLMQPAWFDVREFAGQKAALCIVDQATGGWGHIGIDYIVFSDKCAEPPYVLEKAEDYGTLTLAALDPESAALVVPAQTPLYYEAALKKEKGAPPAPLQATAPFGDSLVGTVSMHFELTPGQKKTIPFLIAWHFPNFSLGGVREEFPGRFYASRFGSALEVAQYVGKNYTSLADTTQRWCDTWYDSTLPYWFLDRTFANTSTLATGTCYRFKNGRFWAWEGVECCPGNCTHVWQYAHAMARLFPELERDLRERTDFGIAFHEDTGIVGFRAEHDPNYAIDGQAGIVLRSYREHLMSANDEFLKRNWPRIKKTLEFLIREDGNSDGILEGKQDNTYDAAWFGKIPAMTSLYLAAVKAGNAMAQEVNDSEFEKQTAGILEKGRKNIQEMFNGEYYYQIEDPKHPEAIGTGTGCHVDCVFGQSWAFQVGLGRLFDEKSIRSSLASIWKYNFTLNVGPFKEVHKAARPYALSGEGGLLVCTWPRGGKRDDLEKHWQQQYFNECWTGCEHQAAGHMIWEGMVEEGLAVIRAAHDRYHPRLRNPYNEIECSDHYARAMASYGVYLAACGWDYHGPKGHIGFAPRLQPEDFRAAFTAAEGWGTILQKREKAEQINQIELHHGQLNLRTLAFTLVQGAAAKSCDVEASGKTVESSFKQQEDGTILITLATPVQLKAGEALKAVLKA
ncbi:MAG TPA: GH116 family glycosyl hydrolase [Candidatus Sumerlaeota bacterium]|nr:GH116 family glycosyl hydrolase [Candidatus Sumerlaeota bacterium]